jgi:hypothetical protein
MATQQPKPNPHTPSGTPVAPHTPGSTPQPRPNPHK